MAAHSDEADPVSGIRLKHRPAPTRSTAGTLRDGTSGRREHGCISSGGGRGTTMLVLPPCSRSGLKTALQAAHRPACRLQQVETPKSGSGFSNQRPPESM
jgi:hypothetical protein